MATFQQYEQINICLYRLGFILKKIGISEYSISSNNRSVVWDTNKDVDQKLLDELCEVTTALYKEE